MIILVLGRNSFGGGAAPLAIAACLLATCCYGIGANFTKRFFADTDALTLATWSQVAATVALTPLALMTWPSHPISLRSWLALVALGIACTAIAYALYFRLIRNLGPTRAVSVTYLIPVFGMLWGMLFLGEHITVSMILGAVVILLGVGLTTGTLNLSRVSRIPVIDIADRNADPKPALDVSEAPARARLAFRRTCSDE